MLQHTSPFPSHCAARSATRAVMFVATLIVALVLVGVSSAYGAGSAGRAATPSFAPGRVLVGQQAGSTDVNFQQALAKAGARSLGRLYGMSVHVVEVAPGKELDTIARLTTSPYVRFAEVDQLVEPGGTVNDPYASSEWHLAKINAPTAWDSSTGAGVVIAILDTGIDGTHPDLFPQLVPGWNFYDNNSNTSDVNGHGTAVAGAAAAASNNALGVASVAYGARLMPVRVADPNAYAYWSTVAQALNWAADQGARVANISYVGVSSSSTVQSAASYFRSRGGVVAVCAGNTGTVDNTAPTVTMMVVSATDQNDALTTFSTYGSFVDIAAPGISILTTSMGGGYQYWWGTSLATPVVAATAALVIAKRPDFTAAQVDSALLSSAVDLGPVGKDIYFGSGRVDAAAALQRAASAPAADTTPPTVAIASPTGGSVSGSVVVSVNASDNVGVTRVDLRVNGTTLASDITAPFQFSWDSTTIANGAATLTAVAYDAAGNSSVSSPVSVTIANNAVADTTPPTLTITNPLDGAQVSGTVNITTAVSDNSGAAGITQLLYIDGVLKSSVIGTALSYQWNTRKFAVGPHVIQVTARDQAGNSVTSQVQVTR